MCLKRCGTNPAIATPSSIRSASRRILSLPGSRRTVAQNIATAVNISFSSASHVRIRSIRSVPGVATLTNALLIATSVRVGGRSMKPVRGIVEQFQLNPTVNATS
jgi:hypothetical protein